MPLVIIVTSSSLTKQVLEYLLTHGTYPGGVSGLARELGTPYAWTWRAVRTLEQAGVVQVDRSRRPHTLRVRIGGES